jgi:dolichyl-phosphate beta-glucosyltransferase
VGLSVVVPAYNEARRLRRNLPRLLEYVAGLGEPAEIIVVDDGSADDTAQVVTELGRGHPEVSLLRSAQNRGKGASVRTGMLTAREEHVLFTDADLAAPIEEAAKLRAGLAHGYDVAIGSRRLERSDIQVRQPWLRELAGRAFTRLVSVCLLPGIRDSQCGFKAFHRRVVEPVFRRQRLDGFSFDVEVLWLARRLGYRVIEVPVVWRDDPESHIRLLRDSVGMFCDVARVRIDAWRGRYELTP